MSDGKGHLEAWKRAAFIPVISTIVGFTIVAAIGGDLATLSGLSVFQAFGYFLGRWIDPDLDLVGISSAEGRMMKDFGCIGVLFVMYWLPYSYCMRFIGGHRSKWSHSFVGTIIRFIYAFWWIMPLSIYLGFAYQGSVVSLGILIGLAEADQIHYLKDRKRHAKTFRFRSGGSRKGH